MSEFLVSEQAAPTAPAVTNNSRSQFVIVWHQRGGLVAALFNLAGQPQTGELAVSTASGVSFANPVATHLAGSSRGFAVAWLQGDPPRVMCRRFTPDGEPREDPLRLSGGMAERGVAPAIARASDGNAIVCWLGEDGAVHAVTLDPDRLEPRPSIKVSPAEGQHGGPIRVAGLENNSFGVCWMSGPSPLTGVMLQVVQTTGTKVGNARVLDPSSVGSNFALAPIVGARSDTPHGSFALVHVSSRVQAEEERERLVVGTIFGPSGDRLLGGSFNITQRVHKTVASNLAMAAQPNGRFLVVWSDRPLGTVSTKGETVRAMPCDDSRGPLLPPDPNGRLPAITISEAVTGNQGLPGAAFAFDAEAGRGATAIAWIDDSHNPQGAALPAVKARILDPVQSPV